MSIKLNNVAFNNGGIAKFNNVSLSSIKYGATEVWKKALPILENGVSYYGDAAIVASDAIVYGMNTNIQGSGWHLQNDGRAAAALANPVSFTGYSKLCFQVSSNNVFSSLNLGFINGGKGWLTGGGITGTHYTTLTSGQTGVFSVPLTGTSGYIHIENNSSGIGVSPKLVIVSKIWLE